jgi:hypothetical protein
MRCFDAAAGKPKEGKKASRGKKGNRGNKSKAPGTAVRASRVKPGMAFRGVSVTTTRAERFHEQTLKMPLLRLNIT